MGARIQRLSNLGVTMRNTLFCLLLVAASCVGAAAQSATIVAQVSITNQSASIPRTVLVTPSADALYRVTAYFDSSKLDQSKSVWCLVTAWTDDAAPRRQTVHIDSSANQGYPTWLSTTFSTRVKAGVSLIYEVTRCTGQVNNPFDLYLTVEQLQ
jgi:hypothetical protein